MASPNQSLRVLFLEALDIEDPAQRAVYLERACGNDTGLRRNLEELIAAHVEARELLTDRPGTDPTDSAVPAPAAGDFESKPGNRIDRYKLLQKIGEGGCGVVYMAEQEEPVRRRVALKIIKPGLETNSVIARFEAERQALAMMNHPNIAKLFDAGVVGEDRGRNAQSGEPDGADAAGASLSSLRGPPAASRPYFVMELVPGIRLTEYCDQHRLGLRE